MNQVQLYWNITQSLELKQTPNGNNVINFSIATNKKIKWEQHTEFHNLVAWGKTAEIIAEYLDKWSPILIKNWELQTRSWEADDGTKRYKTEIMIRDMWFVWGWTQNNSTKTKKTPTKKQEVEEDISVEDIPF